MKIGIAQINTQAGDFRPTCARMEAMARAAHEQGAELLVFPLAAFTGPQPVEYTSQEGTLLDASDALVSLSDAVACPCLVPVVSEVEGAPFAEVMLVGNGEVTPLRMFSYVTGMEDDADDVSALRSGLPEVSTFEFGGLRMGLAFTYDDIEAFIRTEERIDVLLFFSVYGYALDDASSAMGASLAENRFGADAMALDAWFAGVASLGTYGLQVFCGSSFVLSPVGELAGSAPAFEEALLVTDVDVSAGKLTGAPFELEIYNRSLHLWESLSLGVHDFLAKAGKTDVALVLDGSLASTLLAVLASDAVGPRHVHAIVAPAPGWSQTAEAVVEALRLDVADTMPAGDDPADLLHAGISQALLSSYASSSGAVALSHEDKTFLAVEAQEGACRAFALLPFGDVYRTDLIELAHMRNTISPIIPSEAFQAFSVPRIIGLMGAEPTPEMRLRRVDVTLATYVEWERPVSDVAARQGDAELTQAILGRMRDCEAARMAYAPYLVMSSRTLFDARLPLGYAWRDRVRGDDERIRGDELAGELARAMRPQEPDEGPAGIMGSLFTGSLDEGTFMNGLLAGGGLPEGLELPEGVDRGALEGSMRDIMGLLQDLLQGGGLTPGRGDGPNAPLDGPFGPLTWGGPFSEN